MIYKNKNLKSRCTGLAQPRLMEMKRSPTSKATYFLVTATLIGSSVTGPRVYGANDSSAKAEKATETTVPNTLKPVGIFDYRDPDSKELIRFQYQPSTAQELRRFAPSKVRTMTVGVPPKGGFISGTKKLVHDFPAEYLAFSIAVALSTTIHWDNDPMFAQNFVAQNASATGVVSFFGFIAASRASQTFMQTLGVAYDPRRAPLDYRLDTPMRAGSPVLSTVPDGKGGFSLSSSPGAPRPDYMNTRVVARPLPPTRFQRAFAPLLGPIGLSAGMTVSNVIHEVIADPNLHLCAKASAKEMKQKLVSKFSADGKEELVPADPKAAELLAAAVNEACDKAWEDWAVTKKIMDYTPDLLAMASASLIQAYVVNKGIVAGTKSLAQKGAAKLVDKAGIKVATNTLAGTVEATALRAGSERYIPIVLRGLRLTGQVGSWASGPVGKFVMTMGNIFIFMEIVHPITPLLKKPFEQARQGNDITQRINAILKELDRTEKAQWVWAPRPDSDFCTGFEMDIMGNPTPNMNCYVPEQKEPAFLLKKMAERQAKWREFILQDAYLAHANWQKYVTGFATMYANATAFYQQTLAHINYQRFNPQAAKNPSYLYRPDVSNGLYTDPESRTKDGARQAVADAREWLETYLEGTRLKARTSKLRLHSTEATILPEILTALKALDPAIPLSSLNSVEVSFRNLDAMKPEARAEFEARARERLLAAGLTKLRKVLNEDIVYGDKHTVFGSPQYKRMAEGNPFMMLRMKLGNPEPLDNGVGYIRASNDDATIIEQETKAGFPGGIGRARARSMADFLAISMVCGPEADPTYSNTEKIQIYKKRGLSTLERTLDFFGLGRRNINANDAQVLIAVQEHTEEQTKSQKNWYHIFGKNAVATEWSGFWADFRPPRIVDGVPASICQGFPDNNNRNESMWDPYTAKWNINGEQFNGILDIIRKKARPGIVGTAMPGDSEDPNYKDPFDTWWTAKIDKHVHAMVAKLRGDYRLVLKSKYVPALTRNGSDGAAQYNGRTIKLGALEALYDEANLYLLILGKTGAVTKDAQLKKKFSDLSSATVLDFKNMGELVTDLEFVEQKGVVANAAYELKRKSLEERLGDLKDFVAARETATKATADMRKINEQTLKNLNGLMGELDSYWGVIRSIQVVEQ